jgi:hypothetical protein
MVDITAPSRTGSTRVATLIFAGGFCLYALFQFTLVLYPVLARPVPPWPMDAYVYMAKAEQLRSCFRQDCPALQELRQQVQPDPEPERNWQRNRAYHRVLYTYHPLHSALVAGFRGLGLEWEAAYNAVAMLGGILLGGSVAYFLYAIWGYAAAGLGLLFLAPIVFPGFHGIHWIVPSNLALAIGLFTWAAILHGRPYAHPAVPLGIGAALAMHPGGQAYAGLTLLLYLALADRRARRTWLVVGLGAAVILAYLALPYVVARPSFVFWKHPPPADWTIWQGLWGNLTAAWGMLADWARRYGGLTPVLAIAGLGLVTVPGERRRRVYVAGGLLGTLTVASVLYVLPRYPAEVFSRLWIPAVIFATGCIGQAAWFWITTTVAVVAEPRHRGRILRSPEAGGDPSYRLALPGLLLVGALLLYGALSNGLIGGTAVARKLADLYSDFDYPVDAGQPTRVLAAAGTDDRVLYMGELPLHLYLLRGGLGHGLVYYPAVAGSPIERELLGEDRNVGLAVALHDSPLMRYSGGLWLADDNPVEIAAPAETAWNEVAVNLDNPGEEAVLSLVAVGAEAPAADIRLTVPAGWSGWLRLPLPADAAAPAVRLAPASAGRPVKLTGLRLGGDGRHAWPWDQGVTLRYSNSGPIEVAGEAEPGKAASPADPEAGVVRFESRRLLPPSCEGRGVLEDAGVTVAIAVSCRAQP